MAEKKVAIITGGASGMGLAVATSLSKRPDWTINILDLNATSGEKAASSINATFHQSDVTNYNQLASIFKSVFQKHKRLDFVFANAGIAEHANFFIPAKSETTNGSTDAEEPPPEPKGLHPLIDINLKAVITTTTLASHYMQLSPNGNGVDKSIVMTASCGALYPSFAAPIYTATKHAVLGFMRSIAPFYNHKFNIRVNAVLPGTVKTNLLSNDEWKAFPEEYFTPVENIVKVVEIFVDGEDSGEGRAVAPGEKEVDGPLAGEGKLNGKAIEVCGWKHYYREHVAFCDEGMAAVMGSTAVESWT